MKNRNYLVVILLLTLTSITGVLAHSLAGKIGLSKNWKVFKTVKIKVEPAKTKGDPEKLTWYGFEEGYKKAIKDGKILLVDAYTDWCGWCKVMDRETYTNSEVIAALNKDFVCVKFNPEVNKSYIFGDRTMDGRTLLLWLGYGESSGYPTTYFWIEPKKDDRRFNQAGYLAPDQFLQVLAAAKLEKK